jgi:DNA repair photolyase
MTQRNTVYDHVQVKKMLHYVKVWFLPFKWGANTYRGCEHNCLYCNARYTHEYLGLPSGAFAHKILVKDNAAEVLDKAFSRATWRNNLTVNLATVTDPYQPAENRFKITRRVLEVFLKHHNALLITTKSDLILRDLDLLKQIGQTGFLNVSITLPTLDEDLRKLIEPNAPSIEKRLRLIRELHLAGITTGVTAIPLLPYISDYEKDVEHLIKAVAENGADYVVADLLNFRGETRTRYRSFLQTYDSTLIPKYETLYPTTYCDKTYTRKIRRHTNKIIKKFGVDQYEKMYSFRRSCHVPPL